MTPARRALAVVSAGILVIVLLAAVFRAALVRPLIVRGVERSLGLRVTIAEVGGSVVAGLELGGVGIKGGKGTGPLAAFEARRVEARYSLAALLRGRQAFFDSLELALEGARLDLDLAAPQAAETKPAGAFALPRLPRVTVRDSRLSIGGRGYAVEAAGLQGTLGPPRQGGEQALNIQAERFSLRHPALREGTLPLAVAGSYAPHRLTIASATANGQPLVEKGRIDFGQHPGELDVELALRLWQGSVEVGMRRRPSGTEVHWEARGVELQPQTLLTNEALAALRGRLSTRGAVTLGGGLSELAGSFSLDWQGALLAGQAVDRLEIEGTAASGVVLVERAEGKIGPNTIRVGQASIPASPLIAGRWRTLLAEASGEVSATFGDIPAFLALWGIRAGDGARAVPGHRLDLEGSLEKGTLRLARGRLATGLGKATLAGVTVGLPPEDRAWGETAFRGEIDVDIPSLRDLSVLFPMPALKGSLTGRVSGAGTVARPEGAASLAGRGLGVADRLLGDVDLRARGAAGTIEVEEFQLRQGGTRLFARDVRFSAGALASSDREGLLASLSGSFSLRSTDVPALAALAGIPAERLARTPASHLLTAAGSIDGRAISLATGSFSAAGGSILLRRARVALPPPGAAWEREAAFEGDLDVDIPDLAPITAIFGLPPLQGTLAGRARLTGSPASPSGSVEATCRGIGFRGHRIGDIVFKAYAARHVVTVESLEVDRGGDRLRGRGAFDLDGRRLLEAEADVSLADVAPYLAEFVRDGIPVSGRLRGALRAAGPMPGAPLAAELEFSEGHIGNVKGVSCAAEAQIGLEGSLARPSVSVAARVTDLRGGPGGRSAQGSFEATYEPGRLRVATLELAGSGGTSLRGEATLPLDVAADAPVQPGSVSLRAQANIPALEDVAFLLPPAYALTGALRADLDVSGTWKDPVVVLGLRGERLQLPPGTRFVPPGPHALTGSLRWSPAEARAEALRLESPELSCSLSGAWSSPPALSSILSAAGTALTGSLALRASFSTPDIAWLRGSVEGLRGLRGRVTGEIAVDGPAGDPAVSGQLSVADAGLRYKDLPPVDGIAARVTMAGRIVNLGEISGEVGGSPFALSGSVDFTRPKDPVLDLALKGRNALLYRAEGFLARADNDLTLRGPLSALVLAGEVALTQSRYQKNFSFASLLPGGGTSSKAPKRASAGFAGLSFPEPPLRDMRFDVRLTARKPFQILTSAVRGEARPDLHLTGTGLLPLVRGPIHLDGVTLLLPSGTLGFERGRVLFSESELGRAEIELSGRMEARGYEITAQVGGRLNDPEIILSSVPPLPKEELVVFVLTGAPPSSLAAEGGSVSTAATPMAVYLGTNVLESMFGAGSGLSGADLQRRLELQIGREVTRSGSATAEARLLLKKNPLARDSALYLTGEKDVYDQENVGLRITVKFR